MSVNIFTDRMQCAELFGKPVLTTNGQIPREAIPDGWFCYDLQGTNRAPDDHTTLVESARRNHSGTVLSPMRLMGPLTMAKRIGKGDYILQGEEMSLEDFCNEYGLKCPENPIKFEMRPALPEEAGVFYALPPEQDEELGAIGHVRMDFGHHGKEFWHTWWPRGPEELNSPEFREELGQVMDQLRRGVLKDLDTMERWCESHGGEISGGWSQNYGYIVETERYCYCLRCNPVPCGDYQAYLTAFDKQVQELNLIQAEEEQEPEYSWPAMGGIA